MTSNAPSRTPRSPSSGSAAGTSERREVRAAADRGREAPLVIRTETLDIDLVQRRADTNAVVAVELGRSRLGATGLHADMKADSLRLESAVHGEYSR